MGLEMILFSKQLSEKIVRGACGEEANLKEFGCGSKRFMKGKGARFDLGVLFSS